MSIALPQFPFCPVPRALNDECHVVSLSWGRECDWNDYVHAHPLGTVFHTLAWRNAVGDSFGHAQEYFAALRGGRLVGVLPMFLVRGPIIGRMLVSVPYAVGGGILADDEAAAEALFGAARRSAADLRCTMLDFRSERACVPTLPVVDQYVGFERELPGSAGEVAEWLPRKVRAVVRNAQDKYGLQCEFGPDALPIVWELYCRNMRRLASINYPFRFFERLFEEFREQCWICVVRRDGRPVAGLMTLLFRDRVLPYFFGCREEARTCGAANFIYSSVMERAVAERFRVFDFGRSRRDNKGSCDFKRFHGFEARPLAYQRYFLESKKTIDLSPDNPAFGLVRSVWPHLPLSVTRSAGAVLSQYIPG